MEFEKWFSRNFNPEFIEDSEKGRLQKTWSASAFYENKKSKKQVEREIYEGLLRKERGMNRKVYDVKGKRGQHGACDFRAAPYDVKEKCDVCGKQGTYDFMGDYICEKCIKIKENENN